MSPPNALPADAGATGAGFGSGSGSDAGSGSGSGFGPGPGAGPSPRPGPNDGSGRAERVPVGDLRRAYTRHRLEIDAAVARTLAGGWYVLGAQGETFERAFAAYCGVAHAVGVGNGTDAIELALRALGVVEGDEVITSPLSAAFTALAISRIGARPVFVDIDPQTYNLDAGMLEAAITEASRVILPVHLYGQPADMAAIDRVAREHGLLVIEDAAQAHGAMLDGRRTGGLARAAAFSFYPSKNLGAFGDGGAVTTDDEALAERLRMLRNGGQAGRYDHRILGMNSRLDEVQAAILAVRLRHLEADNERRREIAARYDAALSGIDGIRSPFVPDGVTPSFHLYVIRCEDREAVAAGLAASGVDTAVHYPYCIHRQPAYAWLDAPPCPEAERAVDQILSLPIFPELEDAEVDRVCEALRRL